MAKKISQLPTADALTGAETLVVVQGGVSKKTTVSDLPSLWGGAITSAPGATAAGVSYYADSDFSFGGFTIFEGTILTAMVDGANTYAQFLKVTAAK